MFKGSLSKRFTRHVVRGLAVLAIAMMAGTAASAAVQQAPGSHIKMDVPPQFEASKLFSGFINPAERSSIVLAELPGEAYDRIIASFSDAALAKKGITDIKREKLQRSDPHLFFTGQQVLRGSTYKKYVLLIKNAAHVGVITVNVPEIGVREKFIKHEDIIKALTSAELTAEAAPIVVPFTLAHLGPFKQAGKLSGTAILYTTDGQLRAKSPDERRSMVIIAPSVDRVVVPDMMLFSEQALRALGGYRDIKISKLEAAEVGGLKGARVAATARDSGGPVELRQLVLERDGGGYFRLLAIIRSQDSAALLPEADKLMDGFKPKE